MQPLPNHDRPVEGALAIGLQPLRMLRYAAAASIVVLATRAIDKSFEHVTPP